LVFLSSIPLTIVMNGVRIGLVGVTVNHWGTQAANDVLHFFEGWIIFVASAGLLALVIYCLARMSGKSIFDIFHLPKGAPELLQRREEQAGGRMPLISSLLILCLVGIPVSQVSGRSGIIPDRARFVSFPERIGTWQGRAVLMEPEVERALAGLDDYVLSDYQGPAGKAVNLYVAYYSSQRKSESPHSPILCIPGDGWQINKVERKRYAEDGTAFSLKRVVIERNSVKQIVYYWFDERGRKFADEFLAKWYLFTDSVALNRTDGALVRLTTQIYEGETERDADQRLQTFMLNVMPILTEYLPSEVASNNKSARL